GRFFPGSMNEKRDASSGALYRLNSNGTLTEVVSGVMISNGLAWSPDGKTMYHADTPAHTIRAYDYDLSTGTPTNSRTFAHWLGETDRPDGGAVDSAGNYWSAFYGGGKIVQLSREGPIMAEFRIPSMCP